MAGASAIRGGDAGCGTAHAAAEAAARAAAGWALERRGPGCVPRPRPASGRRGWAGVRVCVCEGGWSGCDGLGVTGGEWFLSVCGWLADLCCVLRLLDCVCVRVVVNI